MQQLYRCYLIIRLFAFPKANKIVYRFGICNMTNCWLGSQFSAYLFYHGDHDHEGERKYCGQRRHGRVGEGKLQNIQLILCWHWNGAWRGSRSTSIHKRYERTNLLCILLTFCATVLEVGGGWRARWHGGRIMGHCNSIVPRGARPRVDIINW